MSIDDFGGRKFIFAMFSVFGGLLLAVLSLISFDQFMAVLIWSLGIFSVSNAVAHLSDK